MRRVFDTNVIYFSKKLSQHQQQVATAVERAKQVTMTELNAIIGVRTIDSWPFPRLWFLFYFIYFIITWTIMEEERKKERKKEEEENISDRFFDSLDHILFLPPRPISPSERCTLFIL